MEWIKFADKWPSKDLPYILIFRDGRVKILIANATGYYVPFDVKYWMPPPQPPKD